jgi:hypothetical protein
MFQKINIILLLVFILYPISDAKSDTSTLHTADMINPVDGTILRGFLDAPDGNNGIDIQVEIGTPVKAALDGTVVLVNTSDTNDNIILLRHKQNIYTVYSKLINVTLAKGNIVKAGEKIGFVGSGNPPLLHFEVRDGTKPIDPTQFLTFQKHSKTPLTEKLNLTGIKVKRCPDEFDEILSFPSGTICYTSALDKFEKDSGCLLRVIYESGRGNILRVGKWTRYFNGKRSEGYHGEHETMVGTWKYFDEEGELERTFYYKPVNDELIYDCVLDE